MSARGAGFAELLERLGYGLGDPVPICHQPTGGEFAVTWSTAGDAPEAADKFAGDCDIWFGVNAMASSNASRRRGGAGDVERLAALWADLDIKPGGMADAEAAVAVIADLSTMLGTRPVAIVQSGHGLQPCWALEVDDPAVKLTDDNRPDAVALLRRWGRLVAHVAEIYGGHVDQVFDLARVLRVPGTWNRKAEPVPVKMSTADGRPLTVTEIDAALVAYNAVEQPGDRDLLGDVTAPASGWGWAGTTHPAVARAVASWSRQTPKGRHPWLLGCATSLAFARRLGWITEADHAEAITTLSNRFGWLLQHQSPRRQPSPGEIVDCLTFGVAKAETKSDDDARADWAFWLNPNPGATGIPRFDPQLAEAFWSARPVLAHLHEFARARRASPWAVLGIVLARVVVAVPAHVVLPPLIGGVASLNLFVGLVGPSGSGKGAAEAAGTEAVQLGHLQTAGVGSGEGIAHLFMTREKRDLVQHTRAVLFTVPEVDSLTALTERRGATLLPELRKAWVGEPLGFAYADPTKRLPVPAHQYRLAIVAGIQPARAAGILNDKDAGTPQRFLWLPATDPDVPDVPPDAPDPHHWQPPVWPARDRTTGRVPLPVCEHARAVVDSARVARLRGDGDALDGHGLLARLKVGAALALLDGRAEVADDDWTLAGTVLDVSNATRAEVVETMRSSTAEANRNRGEAEGERAVIVTEKVEDAAVRRVARLLTRKLVGAADGIVGADLRKRLAGRDRGHFDAAIDRLLDAGQIIHEDITWRGTAGVSYRLAEGVR